MRPTLALKNHDSENRVKLWIRAESQAFLGSINSLVRTLWKVRGGVRGLRLGFPSRFRPFLIGRSWASYLVPASHQHNEFNKLLIT